MWVLVDRTALRQVFTELLGFPANHFTVCSTLIIIYHPQLVQYVN
jgi:hypothetical protein